MRMVNGEARKAGVEMRRYTSKAYAAKEFYTEVPFEVELDGSYYSMLGFFDRLTKVERIVNVTGLSVASVEKAFRCPCQAQLPIRARRKRSGDLLDHDVFQPRSGSGGSVQSRHSGQEVGGQNEADDDHIRFVDWAWDWAGPRIPPSSRTRATP